ncbi:MAG TPA: ABC transporter permease, partial [Burkholderiales bacterium]|nr:ABC transporter permease [Burkholderiales bacterium]
MSVPATNTSFAVATEEAGLHQVAASMDFDAELTKAGAHVKSRWGMAWFLAKRYPLGGAGLAIVVLFVAVAVFAPYITQHDPLSTNPTISLAAPSLAHPMGADFMGRDLYSRVVYGARTSLAVGFGATILGVLLGVLIGLACGYVGGWFDLTVQRLIDMLQSLPTLILAMAMAAALGPSMVNTIIAIAIPKLPSIARVIRANTLYLREMPF